MDTLLIMLKHVMIFVLLAVPGYLLVKGNVLKPQDSGTLSKLLTNIGMPALVLSSTLGLDLTGQFTVSMVAMAIVSIVFTAVMFLASRWLCAGEKNQKTNGMMRFSMVFVNSGFIGIPLAGAVFGGNSPVVAYVIVSNIVMNVMLFTLGVYLVSGDKNTIHVKKAVLTPVFLAFLAGIALNLLGVNRIIPEIQTYATHLKGIVTPLSMAVLGMKLADVPMKQLFTSPRMYYVSFVRLVLYPVVGLLFMMLLCLVPAFSLNADSVIGFFIGFAMPTAGLASVFSDQYGGDTDNAVILTLGTTIVSILTIPVLYWVLRLVV